MPALTLTMRPLEPPFRGVLDDVARGFGFPTSVEVTRLGALVAELSARYNDRSAKAPVTDDSKNLAARLLFSFPRDLQKGAAAEPIAMSVPPRSTQDLMAGTLSAHPPAPSVPPSGMTRTL